MRRSFTLVSLATGLIAVGFRAGIASGQTSTTYVYDASNLNSISQVAEFTTPGTVVASVYDSTDDQYDFVSVEAGQTTVYAYDAMNRDPVPTDTITVPGDASGAAYDSAGNQIDVSIDMPATPPPMPMMRRIAPCSPPTTLTLPEMPRPQPTIRPRTNSTLRWTCRQHHNLYLRRREPNLAKHG